MADSYSVKINRRDGAVEVSGDKDWVDEKLRELADVYAELPSGDGNGDAEEQKRKRRTPKRKTASTKETKQPRRRRTTARPQKDAEFAAKLTSQVKQELQKYADARSTAFGAKTTSAVTIIAGYLRDEMEMNEVDNDELYTVYSVMGWPTPNITKALENAYSRDRYFGGATNGKRELTQAGETYARHGSLNE